MAYEIEEARRLVVEAGKKLVETGLIARTWGNVSARISDTQFVITPSGRDYETLKPEEIVVVNIEDCSHEGSIKPSSEKGVHADSYKHHPTVNFVIHTHQVKASAISPTGISIKNVYSDLKPILGDLIPCGSYGMPSTNKLRKGVEMAIVCHPQCRAIIMKHHGALCMGDSYEQAFELASALEKCCDRVIKENYIRRSWNKKFDETGMRNYYLKQMDGAGLMMPDSITDLGSSVRNGNLFTLQYGGESIDVDIATGLGVNGIAPKVAKIHAAIYKEEDCTRIKHVVNPDAVAVSTVGKTVVPMLDDFAQIAGTSISTCAWIDGETDECAKEIGEAIENKNAVFIQGNGALITGNSDSDIEAVELVMEKGCEAEIVANLFCRPQYLSKLDCAIMRTIYVAKYSKQIDSNK